MPRKIELDAAQADLRAVEGLLARRSRQTDPVGWLQFSKRREALKSRIESLQTAIPTGASVALFFGGLPVLGTRGIKADFGAKAVQQFQDVITKRFAEQQGPIGSRGPTRLADQTSLLVTDIARGSFGFVLEEAPHEQLVESPLKHVVDEVVDLIYQTSAPDEDSFESLIEEVDPRVLASLRAFFQTLDSEGATMRMVEDEKEFSLPREAIARARSRTATIEMDEREELFAGKLYLLPESKKFELHLQDGSIKGSVAGNFLKPLIGEGSEVPEGILGSDHKVLVRVRAVKLPNVPKRYAYRLLSLNDDTDWHQASRSVPT